MSVAHSMRIVYGYLLPNDLFSNKEIDRDEVIQQLAEQFQGLELDAYGNAWNGQGGYILFDINSIQEVHSDGDVYAHPICGLGQRDLCGYTELSRALTLLTEAIGKDVENKRPDCKWYILHDVH